MSRPFVHFVPINGPWEKTACGVVIGPGVMHTANPSLNAVSCHGCRQQLGATHAITSVTLIPPNGANWACTCGVTGISNRPILAVALSGHLGGGDAGPS